MKFGKRYSKVTVFMAMLHGVIIGIAAVALIGFILMGTSGKQAEVKPKAGPEIPITGPVGKDPETPAAVPADSVELFARQYGVFTSQESAALFVSENPLLAAAAVIKEGEQYFVWTAIGLSEAEIVDSDSEETFKKRFFANTSACAAVGAGNLQSVLSTNDITKIKNSAGEKGAENADEFAKNLTTITTFTNDIRVIRAHLLSHYSLKKECIKFTF